MLASDPAITPDHERAHANLYQSALTLTYYPNRHGPACPGHLCQHVPRQVARTRRAPRLRKGMHDGNERSMSTRTGISQRKGNPAHRGLDLVQMVQGNLISRGDHLRMGVPVEQA